MTPLLEIREMLDMIKIEIVRYGLWRVPGDFGRWRALEATAQDPNVWNRFVASGGFDAFIWYLFEDAKRANSFMENIWPEEFRQAAAAAGEGGWTLGCVI